MKRLLALLLALAIVFGLAACKKKEETPDGEQLPEQGTEQTVSDTPTNNEETDEPAAEQSEPVDSEPKTVYDLDCRSSGEISWQTVSFSDTLTNLTISLNIPSDWSLVKEDDSAYTINRGGSKIGDIKTSSFAEPRETLDKASGTVGGNIAATKQISLHQISGEQVYYHSYGFEAIDVQPEVGLYLRVKYTELDPQAANKIYSDTKMVPQFVNYTFPSLSETNGSKKILILGNSFVGHSEVGKILNDMLSGGNTGYTAEPIAISSSSASTFAENEGIMNRIKSGEFCYVFQCGFYNSAQNLYALDTIKAACDVKNTRLVVFPAHNENEEAVQLASAKYPDAIFLNWQKELNDLIKKGVPRSELCKDDNVQHSKPLAGYVGAHMIYRSVFGKLPPDITSSSITQSYVDTQLGSYVDTYNKPTTAPRPSGLDTVYKID